MAAPRNLVNFKDVAKGYGSRSVLSAITLGIAAGDDYDFQFAGVARPHDVVEAVHRAQREADVVAPAAR